MELKVRKEMLQKHCEQKTFPHLIQFNLHITRFAERMKNYNSHLQSVLNNLSFINFTSS